MVLGLCIIKLHIPFANSLKSKRGIIKSLIHKLQNKYNISVCELDEQDVWRRSTLGLAYISKDQKMVHKIFSDIEKYISSYGELDIIDFTVELM